jgi:amino acid transporter
MTDSETGHHLKRELRLRDLVQMQILLVVGVTWVGIAAKQGGTHLVLWLAAVLTLFLPSAAVVSWCARIWPEEGGLYQWTRHTFGPMAGFLSVANVGILTATSLAYTLGPSAAWMAESKPLIHSLNIGLFAIVLVVCVVGLRIGKWVAHFGTATIMLINLLLVGLLFYHPHASAAHPHHSPQPPFSLAFGLPMLTFLSLNLFSKMALNGLTGLEQVAVFAGETRNAASSILRSAWIAAPVIALIFILGTGSILTYVPADQVDLNGPVPQILAAAFGTSSAANGGLDWGATLGRAAILLLAISVVAQYTLIVAETARLPMVAGWDGILPEWFTRLSPRYNTPVRSIVVIVVLAVIACTLANLGTGAQEAYQLLTNAAADLYDIYFGMMFLIPLFAGSRFGHPPSLGLRIACGIGFLVTVLHFLFSPFAIIPVPHPLIFGAKLLGTTIIFNLVGAAIYWWSRRSIALHA